MRKNYMILFLMLNFATVAGAADIAQYGKWNLAVIETHGIVVIYSTAIGDLRSAMRISVTPQNCKGYIVEFVRETGILVDQSSGRIPVYTQIQFDKDEPRDVLGMLFPFDPTTPTLVAVSLSMNQQPIDYQDYFITSFEKKNRLMVNTILPTGSSFVENYDLTGSKEALSDAVVSCHALRNIQKKQLQANDLLTYRGNYGE